MSAAALVRVLGWLATVPPPTDPLGPVDQDPDQIRNEACKVVSSNPSACVTNTTVRPPTGTSSGGGIDLSWLSMLLWVLLIAAVVAVLALLLRKPLTSARKNAKADADREEDDEVIDEGAVFVDRSREPIDWRREADEHRRAGRFREALRCRYRALVGDLARRGLIDEIPGRTTGEHRRQVHQVTPAAATPFDRAADLFDGAWYGHFDVDAADDDRFVGLEQEVLGAARERAR